MKVIGKLSKKKALQICFELWSWLSDTGEADKWKWPGWKKYGMAVKACPCCEYRAQNGSPDIIYKKHTYCVCLLDWPGLGCMRPNSPYISWTNTNSPDVRKHYANKIANMALEALREA